MLFAGSNLGVTDDGVPKHLPFSAPNLGAALIANGLSFRGYSEDLPEIGFGGRKSGHYARKHNPWVNWQDAPANAILRVSNLPLTAWPADLTPLPTVAFVVPNLQHDMHDGSIAEGDWWLKANLDGYVQWVASHNSLLVFTFDEDDGHEN
jgi:acid phosphatase